MNYDTISAGSNVPASFNVIIEMAALGDPVKYEVEPSSGRLRVETFMMTSMRYPANYGFVPETLAPDGRPLDALVVTPFPIVPGAVVEARALGTMHLTNERGPDAKLIAVPVDSVCPLSAKLRTLDDLPLLVLHEFRHFFVNYKVFESGRWSRFEHWSSENDAHRELLGAIAAFRASREQCQ
ncbi:MULTISPECIES: inorganic diphosphatase [Burkholderia cepacia complex]|jgi:inorganic pyrophosphatase|uniref:Inorganic pyrophosphatase n=2 Tax=Burkholderia cepacia complex TaxID=87882 RepID=A0A132EA06_9BURK|nr:MULTISPECIES: inorganic diphosphatase [Burkholderia cepacia complex]EGD06348.1 inorganic pyrophosphatase [Burkholderia sp. TJI49]KWF20808.1 inorganic pyrophosphatase [Burkholderia pseudomultivorans]MBR8373010.1 inorganic diphosphatase [Burkholderia cenocepacia]MBR8441935.1 inorganic diphosphatase [Burkholderia cenocepacia]MBU9142435.1 inorganic diphosphatase [Burkholderia multivorans]